MTSAAPDFLEPTAPFEAYELTSVPFASAIFWSDSLE